MKALTRQMGEMTVPLTMMAGPMRMQMAAMTMAGPMRMQMAVGVRMVAARVVAQAA